MRLILGIGCLVVGLAVMIWTNGRIFNRRNAAGVEEFRTYGHSLLLRAVEGFSRLAAWLLILIGGGLVLVALVTGQH